MRRLALVLACATSATVAAAEPSSERDDAARIHVSADSYLWLFERALQPGPSGALVTSTTHLPLYQYASLACSDLDTPWRDDSVDVELAAWGSGDVAAEQAASGRSFDGDVLVASVRQRFAPASVTLGRQLRAGGAARLSRFDGAALDARAPFGLGGAAYAGFVVLPRWSARPGYQLLGSASDTLVRDPAAIEPKVDRAGAWLAGGRAYYAHRDWAEGGLSFHEQRIDGELERRELGLDARVMPIDELTAHGRGLLDLDAGIPSEAQLALDANVGPVALGAHVAHLEPALLLSHQSVLSVFSHGAFEELAARAEWRPWPALALGGEGSLAFLEGDERAARGQIELRLGPSGPAALWASFRYGRAVEGAQGYHALRSALACRPLARLGLSAEAYGYLYDQPIAGVPASLVLAGSAEWRLARGFEVLGGGSFARTPYSALDAQALLRLSASFDFAVGGQP